MNRVYKQEEGRVLIFTRILTSYRKPFLDLLHQRVSFKLIHGRNKSGINQPVGSYSQVVKLIHWGKGETQVFVGGVLSVFNTNVRIVVYEFAIGIISFPIVFVLAKILRKKIALWSHGYNRKRGFFPESNLQDKYRLFLMKRVNAVMVYGDSDKTMLSKYIDSKKIFAVHNTLDTNFLFKIRDELVREGRTAVRKRLGMDKAFNITYIGRLMKDKRPLDLIELLMECKVRNIGSVEVYYVGDGPMKSELIECVDKLQLGEEIHLLGEVYNDYRSGEILFSSDLMVITGGVGLSVNHAFCFDCPVMTFDPKVFKSHGPEVDYIKDGFNGFFVKPGDINQMVTIVERYMNDKDCQKQIRTNVRNTIERDCSIEQMVNDFITALNYLN